MMTVVILIVALALVLGFLASMIMESTNQPIFPQKEKKQSTNDILAVTVTAINGFLTLIVLSVVVFYGSRQLSVDIDTPTGKQNVPLINIIAEVHRDIMNGQAEIYKVCAPAPAATQ